MSRPFMIIYLFIWLVFSLNVFAIPSSSSSDSSLFVDDKLNNQLLSVSLQLEDPLPFELEPSSDIFLEDESTPGYFPTGIELDLNAPVDENQLGLSDILNEANHPNLEPQFSLNEPNLNGKQILDGGTTEIALNDCSSPSPPFSRTRKRANQCPDPSNPSFSLELPTLESIAEEQSKRKWCWRTAVPGFGNVPICHQPGTLVTRMESMMNPPTNPVGEMGFLYVGYGHLSTYYIQYIYVYMKYDAYIYIYL